MTPHRTRPLSALLVGCAFVAAVSAQRREPRPVRWPLAFEPAAHGGYVARGPGHGVQVDGGRMRLSVVAPDGAVAALTMEVVGAHEGLVAEPRQRLPGVSHHLVGNDPDAWRCNVPRHARVRYAQVLPGIDVVYRGHGRQLEYDFVLAPGRDAGSVQLRFSGADAMELAEDGSLRLDVGGHPIVQHPPVAYQERDGERREVDARYRVLGARVVGFEVGEYDRDLPLVIDPIVSYATWFGGSGADVIQDVTTDPAGNIYLTGFTTSSDFPLANPYQPTLGGLYDIFVSKLDPTGSTILWSTFIGGSGGYGVDEWPIAIAVDGTGEPVVLGLTENPDFPVRNAFQPVHGGRSDAVVFRLGANGSQLVWSTFLGGSGFDLADDLQIGAGGGGVAMHANGDATVAATTWSSDFPVRNARQPSFGGNRDVFYTRFTAAGNVVHSSYLGGSGFDRLDDLEQGPSGDLYFGGSSSANWPTTPGVYDAGGVGGFVTRMQGGSQQIVWSTSFAEGPAAVAVDPQGGVYLAGSTSSHDFPTTIGAYRVDHGGSFNSHPWQGWLSKLTADATTLVYSTYYGTATDNESFADLAVDGFGHAYAVGETSEHYSRPSEALLVVKLNATGSALVYDLEPGRRDASGSSAHLLTAGSVLAGGDTWSPSGFAIGGAVQPTHGGNRDGVLVRIDDAASRLIAATTAEQRLGTGRTATAAVTLDGIAPSGGATVTLSSSRPELVVPGSVVVPAGSATATFTIAAAAVTQDVPATITASWSGTQVTLSVTLWPGPSYDIVPILVPNAPDGVTDALDVNHAGTVVGNTRAEWFTFDANGPNLLGAGVARAINDRGQVAGGSSRAFRYTPGAGQITIGALQSGGTSSGEDINVHGQVAGIASFFTGSVYTTRAFRWTEGVGILNLGTLGGDGSEAYGINARGQVTGESSLPGNGTSHAFLHTDGIGMIDLGTLPGHVHSIGYDVNDAGQVVGQAATAFHGSMRAFRLDPGAGMRDLGTLSGAASSGARGVNAFGHVVGWSGSRPTDASAVRELGNGFERLESMLGSRDAFEWDLDVAQAIDEVGRIVGTGRYRQNGGRATGFVLEPIHHRPFGHGCEGRDQRVTALGGADLPVPGRSIRLWVHGRPSAIATIGVATARTQLPIGGGCTLLLANFATFGALTLDADGILALTVPLPASISAGTAYLQAIVLDPASGNGVVTVSNGIELTIL